MIDSVNLDQLRVFLAVCDAGSFSAAARRLRRAQSAVSRAVVALEHSIKVSLFDRSGYIPVLTTAGQSLVADARAAVARVDEFKTRALAVANNLEPNLTMSAHFSISVEFLVPILNEFRTEFPQTPVTLHTGGIGAVLDHVLDGTSAIGVSLIPGVGIELPVGTPGLERRQLANASAVLVVAPSHPLAALLEPVSISELRRHTQLVIAGTSNTSRAWETGNVIADRWWRLTNLHEKHQFLLAGFGWGIMPMNVISKDVAAGRLRKIEVAERTEWQLPIPIYIINRSDRPLGPAGRWMVEAMLACGPSIDRASGTSKLRARPRKARPAGPEESSRSSAAFAAAKASSVSFQDKE